MAVRVRKLAKEMNRDVWEILGLLHAIGFVRYKSPDDMLPDGTVERVKRAEREGIAPVRVTRAMTPLPDDDDAVAGAKPANDDLMSQLVPGVNRVGAPPRPATRPPQLAQPSGRITRHPVREVPEVPLAAVALPGAEAQRAAFAEMRAAVEAGRAALEADEGALRAEGEAIEARRVALEAEREALVEERLRLAGERDQLVEDRARLEKDRASLGPKGTPLLDLMQARGLRGQDEAERALAAMAVTRNLGDLLPRLRVEEVPAVERWLKERLVLVGGPVPEGLGVAAVTVAPERADLPDAASLQKRLTRLSERLLLNGLRRVLLVGGRPMWQRHLRGGLDPRVELRIVPGATRTRADAEQDVSRTDMVVLWGVHADAGALEVYRSARPMLVEIGGDDLTGLLDAIDRALGD